MRLKKGEFVSSLSPLTPTSIINTLTGEYVSTNVLSEKVGLLIDVIVAETARLYEEHETSLLKTLMDYTGTPVAAEFARQKGYKTSFTKTLPRNVIAKSRLEKLVQYKLISEISSYVLNPTPNKKPPTISNTINLGAVDKQMATISLDGSELNLLWKCWDAEYYITFQLPRYLLARDIIKVALPLVRINAKTQKLEFIFSSVEKAKPRKGHKHNIGIDLGKVIPYSMAVVNGKGSRVANYESSPRLTRLARKRERLMAETGNIKAKIQNRGKRGLTSPAQELELERTTDKSTRLTKTIAQQTGSEIARKLDKHNSNLIKVENLSWISGSKNAKIGSSCWSHSQQQDAIIHATKRIGYKTKKVSAKNTSQSCHGCKKTITHRTHRTVWCGSCKTTLDRDFNAAMNIAKQLPFPVSKKLNGDTTSNSGVTPSGSKEVLQEHLSLFCQSLTRKTT